MGQHLDLGIHRATPGRHRLRQSAVGIEMTRTLLAATLAITIIRCEVMSDDGPMLTRITDPVDHAEGPHWHAAEKALYFVDISGKTIHRFDTVTKKEHTLTFNKTVGMVVPVKGQQYKFAVTLGLDIALLTWHWDSGFHTVSTIVSVDQSKPAGNRFNDGKADPNGRVWAGTMGFEDPESGVQEGLGTLYRLDNNPAVPCRAEEVVSPVSISNGLAWSGDNTVLYYIDTPTRKVDAFNFDLPTGHVSNRRTVFQFGDVVEGSPDGMAIDADDNLWIACWGGSQVIQVDPKSGKLMRKLKFPVNQVTSVAFGGEKFDTMYVTTMRALLSPEQLLKQPHAGSVWEVTNLKVIGTAAHTAVVNCKCNNSS